MTFLEHDLLDNFDKMLSNMPSFVAKDEKTYELTVLQGVDIDASKLTVNIETRRLMFSHERCVVIVYKDGNNIQNLQYTFPNDTDESTLTAEITDEGLVLTIKKSEE